MSADKVPPDEWKAMMYELHVKLKSGKQFACRYGCGDYYGIDRINGHMMKTHGWKYPKLGVGQKAPAEISDWKHQWVAWTKLKNDKNFQPGTLPKSPSKNPRGPVAGKKTGMDFKIDWKLDRSVVEEKSTVYAKYAVPLDIVESPPVLPTPLVCEIFTPDNLGERSFTDAYTDKMGKMFFECTQVHFDCALTKLCASTSEEDAKLLQSKASAEYFFLLLPPENRERVRSFVERVHDDVKQYVASVQAVKSWEEEQIRKKEEVERKRSRIVAAKLLEYDSLQPTSEGKDLASKRRHRRDQLAFHKMEVERLTKELEMLEDAAGNEVHTPDTQVDEAGNEVHTPDTQVDEAGNETQVDETQVDEAGNETQVDEAGNESQVDETQVDEAGNETQEDAADETQEDAVAKVPVNVEVPVVNDAELELEMHNDEQVDVPNLAQVQKPKKRKVHFSDTTRMTMLQEDAADETQEDAVAKVPMNVEVPVMNDAELELEMHNDEQVDEPNLAQVQKPKKSKVHFADTTRMTMQLRKAKKKLK